MTPREGESFPDRVRLHRERNRPGARFRSRGAEDPLAGVANLADLMLVFATGLLVALVLAWDMARALDPSLGARLRGAREIESLQRASGDVENSLRDTDGRFRSMGQVYRDTATGKLFVVEEEN